jgi:N-acyl-L-homoserine lactone synthetase
MTKIPPRIDEGETMVIVLYGSERGKRPDYFDRLFRLRHEIFIKQRGWPLPSVNSCEIDQYDDEDAVYFLDINDHGDIQGTVRMTPTIKSSLLADYFPHLIENGQAPRSPHIYEATRYIVLPAQKSREAIRTSKARLLTTLLEWCLSKRLTFLQAVIDSGALSSFVEITPHTIPLGLAHPYGGGRGAPGGGECLAFRWPISPDVLDDVRAYGLDSRQLAFAAFERADRDAPSELIH